MPISWGSHKFIGDALSCAQPLKASGSKKQAQLLGARPMQELAQDFHDGGGQLA